MYRYLRQYKGPGKACILDWSGTVCDRYVMAPAVVFRECGVRGALQTHHINEQAKADENGIIKTFS